MMSYKEQLEISTMQFKKLEQRESESFILHRSYFFIKKLIFWHSLLYEFRGVPEEHLPDDLKALRQRKGFFSSIDEMVRGDGKQGVIEYAKKLQARTNQQSDLYIQDTIKKIRLQEEQVKNPEITEEVVDAIMRFQRSKKFKWIHSKFRNTEDRKIFGFINQKGTNTIIEEERQRQIEQHRKLKASKAELEEKEGGKEDKLYPLTDLNFPKVVPDYEFYDKKHDIRRKFYI